MRELTINLHVTEACNFSCNFCFAHWADKNEIFRHEDRFLNFIEFLHDQSKASLAVEKLTINFAGGEPTLLRHLHKGAKLCRDLGVQTSVISNGLIFKRYSLEEIASYFDIVGISIDSFHEATNLSIGRTDSRGIGFDSYESINKLTALKRDFGVKTKVNTVVSNYNFNEDLSDQINGAKIDRWKIFQLLPVEIQQEVSNERFEHFVARNSMHSLPIVENNEDMMKAYVMVNSNGFLYQSGRVGDGIAYDYFDLKSGSLFEGLRHVGIDFDKYRKRYGTQPNFREFELKKTAQS